MAVEEGLKTELQKSGIFVTTLQDLYNWGRRSSIWPLQFGLACCAIEMIATACARYDIARFGAELFRPSPRQADLMIVAGTVTKKMAPMVVRLYNQMADPKYVIAMGACAISGGPFRDGYNVLKGIDRYIPVDVHVPGCPPRPEALLDGIMRLQKRIDEQQIATMKEYDAAHKCEYPIPEYGKNGLVPKYNEAVFKPRQSWPEANTKDQLRMPKFNPATLTAKPAAPAPAAPIAGSGAMQGPSAPDVRPAAPNSNPQPNPPVPPAGTSSSLGGSK